ncbi:MAG: hypothetical protein FWD26_03515 [Treponema sp.]|nr:hypothetical protein [Treponema sp.]
MKKKITMLICLFAIGFIFCASVFAAGGVELKLTNKTSAEIYEIIIKDITSNKSKTYNNVLQRDESFSIKVKKDNRYSIVMVCANGHKYGVSNQKYPKKANKQVIRNRNYIFEDLEAFLRRINPFNDEKRGGNNG